MSTGDHFGITAEGLKEIRVQMMDSDVAILATARVAAAMRREGERVHGSEMPGNAWRRGRVQFEPSAKGHRKATHASAQSPEGTRTNATHAAVLVPLHALKRRASEGPAAQLRATAPAPMPS